MLEVHVTHLEKLMTNKTLDDSDKAVIYYSIHYDILIQANRNIVLEHSMNLNNIASYGHSGIQETPTQSKMSMKRFSN